MSQGIIFDYYQYKHQIWTCEECGWAGPGSILEVGEVFEVLHELNCPQCDTRMGYVPHPTLKQARANFENLPDDEKLQVKYLESMIDEFDRVCLKSPEQLPEITESNFSLIWDEEDRYSVIKHEGRKIFVEPIIFQDYERFDTVVRILKDRYGDALKGVHPTPAAYATLCGDKLGAGSVMNDYHAKLFGYKFM